MRFRNVLTLLIALALLVSVGSAAWERSEARDDPSNPDAVATATAASTTGVEWDQNVDVGPDGALATTEAHISDAGYTEVETFTDEANSAALAADVGGEMDACQISASGEVYLGPLEIEGGASGQIVATEDADFAIAKTEAEFEHDYDGVETGTSALAEVKGDMLSNELSVSGELEFAPTGTEVELSASHWEGEVSGEDMLLKTESDLSIDACEGENCHPEYTTETVAKVEAECGTIVSSECPDCLEQKEIALGAPAVLNSEENGNCPCGTPGCPLCNYPGGLTSVSLGVIQNPNEGGFEASSLQVDSCEPEENIVGLGSKSTAEYSGFDVVDLEDKVKSETETATDEYSGVAKSELGSGNIETVKSAGSWDFNGEASGQASDGLAAGIAVAVLSGDYPEEDAEGANAAQFTRMTGASPDAEDGSVLTAVSNGKVDAEVAGEFKEAESFTELAFAQAGPGSYAETPVDLPNDGLPNGELSVYTIDGADAFHATTVEDGKKVEVTAEADNGLGDNIKIKTFLVKGDVDAQQGVGATDPSVLGDIDSDTKVPITGQPPILDGPDGDLWGARVVGFQDVKVDGKYFGESTLKVYTKTGKYTKVGQGVEAGETGDVEYGKVQHGVIRERPFYAGTPNLVDRVADQHLNNGGYPDWHNTFNIP